MLGPSLCELERFRSPCHLTSAPGECGLCRTHLNILPASRGFPPMPRFLLLAVLLVTWLPSPASLLGQDEVPPADAQPADVPPADAPQPEAEPEGEPPATASTVPPVVTALEGVEVEQLATGL